MLNQIIPHKETRGNRLIPYGEMECKKESFLLILIPYGKKGKMVFISHNSFLR